MIGNIFITIFLSFFTIFILHYLFQFFQKNLTCPKVKDFIKKPNSRYNEILNIIENNSNKEVNNNITTTNIEEIPIFTTNNLQNNNIQKINIENNFEKNNDIMKSELKNFLKNLPS